MSITKRRFLTISAAAIVTAGYGLTHSPTADWNGVALGADASIRIAGPSHITTPALAAAIDTISRMNSLFSLYDENSKLSKLNRVGHLNMPPEFARLVVQVDRIHKDSQGLFDPTVQGLFRSFSENDGRHRLHNVGWHRVHFSRTSIEFTQANMAATFNGIAQGFATDRVSEVLSSYGLKNILVNVGEYRVGDGGASIGVANSSNAIIAELGLHNEAVATTATDVLTLPDGGSHVVLPFGENRRPVWKTVSVVAQTATVADGLSTALALTSNQNLAESLVRRGYVHKVILEDFNGKVRQI